MSRFFLNIRNEDILVRDEEGDEASDLAQAETLARDIIRDIRSRPETYGAAPVWSGRSFEITDETGALLLSVPFLDVDVD